VNNNGAPGTLDSRLEALILELAAVEREMQRQSALGNAQGPSIPSELLDRFKAAVDRVRLRVWAYMDTRYPGLGKDMQHVLQQRRMERAAELLLAIREEALSEGMVLTGSVEALAEQVQAFHQMLTSGGHLQP